VLEGRKMLNKEDMKYDLRCNGFMVLSFENCVVDFIRIRKLELSNVYIYMYRCRGRSRIIFSFRKPELHLLLWLQHAEIVSRRPIEVFNFLETLSKFYILGLKLKVKVREGVESGIQCI
jgi:hypothetical protein